jgi:hypothetical protein
MSFRRDGTLWVWRDDINPGFQLSEAMPRKLSGAHWLTAAGDLGPLTTLAFGDLNGGQGRCGRRRLRKRERATRHPCRTPWPPRQSGKGKFRLPAAAERNRGR